VVHCQCPEHCFFSLVHRICHGSRVTNSFRCASDVSLIAPSRFGLEHPRPYALCGHCLSSPQRENPATIEKVKAVLWKHPWYANQWQARQDVPAADHALVLFMQAARWPDELRMTDRQHHRGLWHYINWPIKPEGQPPSVQIKDPDPGEHPNRDGRE
jgi:hypothetical protein